MTTYGLRLTGSLRDLAALNTLAGAASDLLATPWTELTEARGARVVTSPRFDARLAGLLSTRGLDVVRVGPVRGGACVLEPLDQAAPVVAWRAVAAREGGSLLEALRPVRLHGDPPAEEACFWVPLDAPGAQQTLERLLALGRDDVALAEFSEKRERRERRVLVVRLARPPMYLLMRAREEPGEEVRAFARVGEADLWVEWSFAHPLAEVAARVLKPTNHAAFVGADGEWRYVPAQWAVRSVYDALVPTFEAPRTALDASPGATKFTIRLRLGAGAESEPELWLLSPEQFMGLETLLENATSDEVARLTVARTTGPLGTRYVLQEIVRPGVARLATRVSDLTGVRGFSRMAGTDNLYLPVGRRLLPAMRRDELRNLLGLDQVRAVVVDEDADGPRVVTVRSTDDEPLSKWVEYVATDRRMALERLLEDSVFAWPEVVVQKRAKEAERERAEAERGERGPRVPRPPRPARPAPAPEPVAQASVDDVTEEASALREEIRALEAVIAEGGCDAPTTWRALGDLKARVREAEEAGACYEAALFHTEKPAAAAALATQLAAQRAKLVSAQGAPNAELELLDLATSARLTPAEAAYLGARVVEMVLRGEAPMEALLQQVARLYAEPELPVSRRLSWLVLATCLKRADDRLGLTRAKERVLGQLNDRGLSETFDLPRFVRYSLALDDGGALGGATTHGRGEQLAVLEGLWALAQARHVTELDPRGAFVRLVFAVGFTRLGATARARDLAAPVEAELGVHEAPNKILFRLYMSRMAHVATQGDEAAWKREAEGVLDGVRESLVRDRVEWLRRRSEWLRSAPPDEQQAGLRPSLERELTAAEPAPDKLAETLSRAMATDTLFDYEVTIAADRMLRAALRSGNDDVLADVLGVATRELKRIQILGHRARAIGTCIRAAATLGDADGVDRLLDAVVDIAGAPNTSVRDLLSAVNPGLAALRRLGIVGSARRFLDALVPIAAQGGREGVKLRAALADGFLQLREPTVADLLLDQSLEDTLEGSLDHVGRYEAGVAVLASLRHWPMAGRLPRCERVVAGLDRFSDTFTARKFYETHKVLVLERLIDTMVDDVTFQSDRVQGYLDAEEQVIRRRIISDWRDACGR